jgi:acetyl esterase/lipase
MQKSALLWVRKKANELGLDANRSAAGGSSAGGHLAAATATVNGFDGKSDDLKISAAPNALVLFNPALNVASPPPIMASVTKPLLLRRCKTCAPICRRRSSFTARRTKPFRLHKPPAFVRR